MLRFAFNALLGVLLLGVVTVAGVALYIVPQLPDIENLRDVQLQVPLRVFTRDGELIAEFGEMRRTPIAIEDVPPQLIRAVLAAEDDRFFEHPGVDWQGLLRAAIHVARTGEKTQGGSTITMQVARNFFLTRERTYARKLNEIFLALKIERELSKSEILELYLNKIYLGQRAYGVAAAAQVYYGTTIDQLDLAQFAMIAGLPQAPSITNPVTNPERARMRRTYVLNRMLHHGYINEYEYATAINSPVEVRLHSANIQVSAPYVAEMVRQELVAKYGDEAYTRGLLAYTTLKGDAQNAANQAFRQALMAYDARHGYRGAEHQYELPDDADEQAWGRLLRNFSNVGGLSPALITAVNQRSATAYVRGAGLVELDWDALSWAREYRSVNSRGPAPEKAADVVAVGDIVRVIHSDERWRLTQIPDVEGALVSLDPKNGATLALVGGFDFQRSKFNRAVQARRQPGSAFKPFIYSAALATGYTPASMINDAPIVMSGPGIEGVWRPQNYSGRYYGPTRLREALALSRNLVSVRLMDAIGIPYTIEFLRRFGFNPDELPHNLSLSLGSGSLTVYEMARAYSVFANGGFLIEPYIIQRLETLDGEVLHEASPLYVCAECVPEEPLDTLAIGETKAIDDDSDLIRIDDHQVKEIRYAPRTIDAKNAWLMTSMNQDVIRRGTGARARELGRSDLAGKTGTTNEMRDAWFAGYNRDNVTVAWVGFDNYQTLGNRETGASAALPMWIEYMRVALDGQPESSQPRPEGLVNVRIDPDTGKLARADSQDAIFEIFPADRVPTEFSRSTPADPYRGGGYSEHLF